MLISEVITINLGKPKKRRKLRLPSTPTAAQLKHARVIRRLTSQITRRSNIPHVTQDDIRIAKSRAETEQKRVDLDYEKQVKLAQQRHDAARRIGLRNRSWKNTQSEVSQGSHTLFEYRQKQLLTVLFDRSLHDAM